MPNREKSPAFSASSARSYAERASRTVWRLTGAEPEAGDEGIGVGTGVTPPLFVGAGAVRAEGVATAGRAVVPAVPVTVEGETTDAPGDP